jgi:hypothetical protein
LEGCGVFPLTQLIVALLRAIFMDVTPIALYTTVCPDMPKLLTVVALLQACLSSVSLNLNYQMAEVGQFEYLRRLLVKKQGEIYDLVSSLRLLFGGQLTDAIHAEVQRYHLTRDVLRGSVSGKVSND